MNSDTFDKTLIDHVETLVERDALEELLQHPLMADLPRAEGYPLLGSYVLFAQLGKGGMANVFRGLHVRLENEVAIKVRTAPAGSSGARFQREATVAAKLEHPNLVRATDVDEHVGLQYMVLDYIDGEDTDERVGRKGPLDARETLTILRDAALGLAEAHRLHFIHRDIKPANVMVSRDGRVKVADLGLAKSVVDDDLGLTATGGLLGTPMYMAPEQFRRSEETCKASDVYGLGATACFLLTGQHPFDGKSVPEIMQQVCVAGIARLDGALPGLDPRVVDLVAEIVALDSEERPADGGELVGKITPVLEAIGGAVDLADPAAGASKARGVRPPTREMRTRIKAAASAAAPVAPPESVVSDDVTEPELAEPRSRLPWVAAAMLLTAAGGLGWSVLQNADSGDSASHGGSARPAARGADLPAGSNSGSSQVPSQVPSLGPSLGPPPGPPPTLAADSDERASIPEVAVPTGIDIAAISLEVRQAYLAGEWGKGYAGLLAHARKARNDSELALLVGPIEEHSSRFRRQRRYETTSALLDAEGQAAVLDLAQIDGLFVQWTAIIAAELAVEFNGLDYVIDDARRDQTQSLLLKAEIGGDDEAAARAKLLQGVMGLDDFMDDRGNDALGRRIQDDLTDSAELDPDGEAAAWLGVLYLALLEDAGAADEVPVWFKPGSMVELLEGSLENETSSADAAFVMGHLSSDGLAGVPRSLEEAKRYYSLGARGGNVGCIREAVLYGAPLGRKIGEDTEAKLLHFAGSETEEVAMHVRDAYALAALTGAFEDPRQDAERRVRAIEFLQANADLDLARKLESRRQFDRVTICLSAMVGATGDGGSMTREDVTRWITDRQEVLAKEIFSNALPPRSEPIWAVLLAFDPALTTEILVAGAGQEQREGIERYVESGGLLVTLEGLGEDRFRDAPYVWGLFVNALETIRAR